MASRRIQDEMLIGRLRLDGIVRQDKLIAVECASDAFRLFGSSGRSCCWHSSRPSDFFNLFGTKALNRVVKVEPLIQTFVSSVLTWRDFISTRSANAINLGKSVAACVCGPSTTRPKRRRRQNKQKGQITIRELYKFAKIRYKQTFIFYACLRVEIKRRVRVTVETGGGNVANQQSSIKIGSAFSVLPSSYLFIADFSELNKTNCYAAKFNRNEQPEAGSVKDSSRRTCGLTGIIKSNRRGEREVRRENEEEDAATDGYLLGIFQVSA
ncbi:hypothetical protein GEV33_005227 [Tenebrio molitor]|uniref:Uncharacterized protein n=1 Tax=Tenebrio molitor TaxID=7067 RepID=A0A8J6HMW5_TENMO|nr:hypothetical protein GEV33_005227 [Tenebrio molitor]